MDKRAGEIRENEKRRKDGRMRQQMLVSVRLVIIKFPTITAV